MDKFSELIAQGVAKFEYTPISHELPETDPIVRDYNNVYSLANDTRMNRLDDGLYVITGHVIHNHRDFDWFLCSSYWGAMNFNDSGMGAPCCFFSRNNLVGHYDILNGDEVYMLEVKKEDDTNAGPCNIACGDCPTCCCAVGSQIPESVRTLTTDGDVNHVYECLKAEDPAAALNENIHVCGVNWMMVGMSDGNHLVSVGKKKSYIL